MNNPKIILADEPTGNLDSQSTEDIYALLREINKKYNTTFVIVTHDRRIAERTDRIVEILDGRIVSDIKKS
jgi:lipoprotein-releasing system ATP-binding protein